MPNEPNEDIVFGLHLVSEIATATQLLASGLNQVIAPTWYASEPAVAFTCISSGVERILKLTYGLGLRANGQSFPAAKTLQKLGHNLISLEELVLPSLIANAQSRGNGYVAALLADVTTDPYWPDLLAALNAWAAATGRYRDLTILTGERVHEDAPTAQWNAVELRCLSDLGLLLAVAGPENRVALVEARTRLAVSILNWWHAIFRAWTHGLVGEEHRSAGTALSPAENRALAPVLVRLLSGR